jgi:hypothetical protein
MGAVELFCFMQQVLDERDLKDHTQRFLLLVFYQCLRDTLL